MVVTDGQRVANTVKSFISTIQNLTTDFLLKEFSESHQYQEINAGNESPRKGEETKKSSEKAYSELNNKAKD